MKTKTLVLTIVPFICDNSESLNWSDIAQTIKKKMFSKIRFFKRRRNEKNIVIILSVMLQQSLEA